MTFKMTLRKVLLVCLIVSTRHVSGYLPVRFAEQTLIPAGKTLFSDDDADTCTEFDVGNEAQIPISSHFRIRIPYYTRDALNVSMLGTNIECGGSFYVTLLSSAETKTWLGRWTTCRLIEKTISGKEETCLYGCQYSGYCEELQIIRMPFSVADSSWSLCDLTLTFSPGRNPCSNKLLSGIYNTGFENRDIVCEMEVDGGGWTVIMRRKDGSVDFNKDWENYKQGFGSLEGEFWAGNEFIHKMTNDGGKYTLRIDMTNYQKESIYAKMTEFSLGPESDNYRFHFMEWDPTSTVCKYNNNNFQRHPIYLSINLPPPHPSLYLSIFL
ncbi:hypothetical protein LSH36_2775g00000 [Paralvinella palmiformis]|uniref:Fibrinogen C-terminal domain-containing protein n=1 Tax=Paralvinella palmiformis TaxID=53620 RepID=A0AAD9MP11_9ANNE|nr:hypothetical protein LSH36_2775g00000 [Paralvinella palmiformis]